MDDRAGWIAPGWGAPRIERGRTATSVASARYSDHGVSLQLANSQGTQGIVVVGSQGERTTSSPHQLACKEESVDFDRDGTFADPTRGFTEEFTEVECPKTLMPLDSNTVQTRRRVFPAVPPRRPVLRRRIVGVRGIDLEEVREGDTITVNFEMYNRLLDTLEDVKKRLIQES